ncbi:MAG: PAS domain-containing protein [Chloroflexi bacterium]|nr:PAS domain-containing protein [Chloroflexota bacterium]
MKIPKRPSSELETLVVTTQILTGPLPFSEKCELVLSVLADFTGSEFVTLREFDPDNSTLNLVSYFSRSPLPESAHIPRPMRETSLSAKALAEKTPVVIEDYAGLESPDLGYLGLGIRSALSIPVQVDGHNVATLGFAARLINHYGDETVRVLAGIADVVGMIMAKAELQEANEVEANIGRIVSAPLVGPDVFEKFAAEGARIIDFERLSLNSVNLANNTFITEFMIGDQIPDYPVGKAQRIDGTALEEVVWSRISQRFRLDDREGLNPKFPRAGLFTAAKQPYLIGVPLIVGDQVIGTMGFNRGSGPFSQKDLAKAERLGSLVAGAFADYKSEVYRREAEEQLKESEGRFRQMAENMRGAFWLLDISEKRMLYVSPNAEDIWGYSAEQFYDDYFGWIALVHPEDRDRVISEIERQRVTGEIDTEFRVVRSDGAVRWLSARGFPVKDEEGRLYRLAGIAEDITEQKSTMQRMIESSHLASIGQLSAGVAHEINNPLASIILYSEQLLGEDLPDSYRHGLEVISEQGKRAAKIVNNLLAFARKSDADMTESDLSDLVIRVLEIKAQEFKINNIHTVVNIEPDLPLVTMDTHLMTQVVLNIINNAEQACAAANRGGMLTVTGSTVAENVRISVSDDGPGIPADRLAKIFEPFFTTKDVGAGTGLGLSVSHGILSQHGGRIWAESTPGQGATFHIEVPIAGGVESKAKERLEESPVVPAAGKSSILVVDDEIDLRNILGRRFVSQGYSVDLAENGEEAWLKINETAYGCIIIDLRLPGISGQELYGWIEDSDPAAAARVLFVTGDTMNPETASFLEGVPNLVLAKPFEYSEIKRLVASITRTTSSSQVSE